MTTVIQPRLLVAGADPRKVDWAIDLLDRAGIRRTLRAFSASAVGRLLAASAIDVIVLTSPMFALPIDAGRKLETNRSSFVILANDAPEKQRWKVTAVVEEPTHPVTVVAALMKTLRERDQVGIAAG